MFESSLGIFLFCLIVAIGASLVILTALSPFIVSHILYTMHLKRKNKSKWSRNCSSDEPDQVAMYVGGVEWSEANIQYKKDLHIVNAGLNLYGEYYDFGYDRAVVVVAGRTEGLRYGYYFSKAYAESGYNVLCIDQRAHGESDGVYNTVGFEEHKDLVAWCRYLHEGFQIKSIILHGICIGSSCSLFALTSEDCPDYLDGMVAEGMYPRFYETFKNHMIDLKKPTWPCLDLVNMWMKHYTGHDMHFGPIDVIGGYKKPILMLHSKEDVFSLPATASELYEKCGSDNKELVWFEHGEHSKLRLVDSELYDNSIKSFIAKNFANTTEKVNT